MNKILNQFLKPSKLTFNLTDLGPSIFREGQFLVKRTEHKVDSIPFSVYEVNKQSPTILYAHTYNSNRLEIRSILSSILKKGFNAISIQFQRVSVHQQNKRYSIDQQNGIITFGYYQFQQLRNITHWIKDNFINKDIILWGRSMGSACCIRYQNKYQDAKHLILDSPFNNLQNLFITKMKEIVSCPYFVAKSTMALFKSKVSQQLKFDISGYEMEIRNDGKIRENGVVFIYNVNDMMASDSCKMLYERYQGSKEIYYTEKKHNQEREYEIIEGIVEQLSKKYIPKQKYILKPFQQKTTQNLTKSLNIIYPKNNTETEQTSSKSLKPSPKISPKISQKIP